MYHVTEDRTNKDLFMNMSRHDGQKYYQDLWGTDFQSKIDEPVIQGYKDKYILRADLAPGGLKAFGGERVIVNGKPTLVYCAPRQGHAPDAIASLAKMYEKRCVFFMPSSKEVSDHQRALFAYDNVDVRFFRIAAMPVLNSYAKKWAEQHQASYLPFGLTGVEMVTAGLVNMCRKVSKILGSDPTEIYCAVSTGTMIRALQIGWPEAEPKGVAVARNIHKGEVGVAEMRVATIPFLTRSPAADKMPIPTTGAYDAKAWEWFESEGKPGSIFINVGSDAQINRNMSQVDPTKINSYREWHDMGDWDDNRAYKD